MQDQRLRKRQKDEKLGLMESINLIYPIQYHNVNIKGESNKECRINIRSAPYIITLAVKSVIIRKFALLSERIGPASGNTGSERRKRLYVTDSQSRGEI